MIAKFIVITFFCVTIIIGQVDRSTVCSMSPFTPLNGKVTYSSGSVYGPFDQGTIATLTCNQGYSPKGPTQLTCVGGKFNPPQFEPCVSSGPGIGGSCGPFPPVANGQISYNGGSPNNNFYPLGTSAMLTCNLGFFITGTAFASCTSFGWSAKSLGFCTQY